MKKMKHGFAFALFVLLSGYSLATPGLMTSRLAALQAVIERERTPTPRCDVGLVEARTNILVFPANRADLIFIYSRGIGKAYVLRGGVARLVWCGKAIYEEQTAKKYASVLGDNAARALIYPFRTLSGWFPVEHGGMDTYSDFAGELTLRRLNAQGKLLCQSARGNPNEGDFVSVFQLKKSEFCRP